MEVLLKQPLTHHHKIGAEGIMRKIAVDPAKGVHVDQVVTRRNKWYGSNAKEKKPLRTICQILCTVLEDFTLRILLAASIATIIINMIVEEEERATGIFFGCFVFTSLMCETV